jgi:hypothetical protein
MRYTVCKEIVASTIDFFYIIPKVVDSKLISVCLVF